MTQKTNRSKTRSKSIRQPALELQEEMGAYRQHREPMKTCWFVTNRNNLLEILSSGMIKPAAWTKKYYNDPGLACPEAIPLLMRHPSTRLIEETIGVDPKVFPVILEVDLDEMIGAVTIILEDYQLAQSGMPMMLEPVCIVVQGIISASRIRSVHFRSITERDEHIAREYENIRSDVLEMHVTPEYFQGTSIDGELLLKALTRSGETCKTRNPELLSTIDALGGALLMLGGLAEHASDLPLTVLTAPLAALQHPAEVTDVMKAVHNSSRNDRLLALLPLLLLTVQLPFDKDGTQHETGELLPAIWHELYREDDLAAFFLFEAAVKIITETQVDDYYNEEVLQHIRTLFINQFASVVPEQTRNIMLPYLEIMDSIQDILYNRLDLDMFPSARFPVATALLLFLLRSKPLEALSWNKDVQRPSVDILAVTVAFAGILYGRSMIPVDCRPAILFEQTVDTLVAHQFNTVNQGLVEKSFQNHISIESPAADNAQKEVLKLSELILLYRDIYTPGLEISARYHVPSEALNQGQQIPASSGKNHMRFRSEEEDLIFRRLQESELKGGVEKEAAIHLCRLAGWDDCVTTVLNLERRRFVLYASDFQKPELRVSGFVNQPLEIIILVDKFRKRLTEEFWRNVSKRMLSEVEEIINNN